MMHFDERILIQELEPLAARLRAAFAASCAERHLPLYENFRQRSGDGHSRLGSLTDTVKELWEDLEEDVSELRAVEELVIRAMEAMPSEDTDSDWPQQQACAEDVAAAVAYALRSRISGEAQEAAWAARRCYELADRIAIHALAGTNLKYPDESSVLSHARVQRELSLQNEALAQLRDFHRGDVLQVIQRIKDWSIRNRYTTDDC